MKIVVTPTQEAVDRAIDNSFEKIGDQYFGCTRVIALMGTELFEPIYYLGTVTILKHKLKDDTEYALTPTGPIYTGEYIKMAMKVLGKRRVRLFIHYKESKNEHVVLMLGTKEGTVAIAPRIWDDGTTPKIPHPINENTKMLSDYWRSPTCKLVRGLIFGTL